MKRKAQTMMWRRVDGVDPAEAEKEKKVETRKLKLDEIPEGSPEH